MKDLERILHYLDNELTGNDVLLLENELKEDELLRKKLELVREMNETIGDVELISFIEKVRTLHSEFISEDLTPTPAETKQFRLHKFVMGWNLMTIAAAFVLILSTVAIIKFMANPSPEAIFNQYYNKYEANIETRSESKENNLLITAIQLYDKGSYTAAIQKFLHIIQTDENNTAARFFLGVSYLETKNIPKAIENLNVVIYQNDTAFVEHAEWYLALCYVRNGQKKQAVSLLTKISSSQNFYKIMALDVLKKIK